MLCIGSCSDARSFYFTTNWAVLTNSVVYDTSFTEDFGSLSYRWIGDIDMTIDRHIVLDGWVDDDGVGTDGDVLSDRWIFDDGGGMNFVHNSKLKNQYLGTFWWQKVPKNTGVHKTRNTVRHPSTVIHPLVFSIFFNFTVVHPRPHVCFSRDELMNILNVWNI
mgnify:CR=1 FL=1